tara:strand:+ start:13875 stop:14480 length:606 start_codon:yes stop_codon:yes gene_type:complete
VSIAVAAKQNLSELPPIKNDYYPIQSSRAGELGDWGQAKYCNENSYIFAAKIMVEASTGGGKYDDDTSLNQITFVCKNPKKNSMNSFKVGLGNFGKYDSGRWKDAKCQDGYYAYGFRLGMEGNAEDYVAATSIRLLCREFSSWNDPRSTSDAIGEFHNEWLGSRTCMYDHLLAGAVARSQDEQGDGDDSALNDIVMICRVE